jgi:pimeloyl-ACP methyl ester carboxylesterase
LPRGVLVRQVYVAGLTLLLVCGLAAQYDPFAAAERVRVNGTELAFVAMGEGEPLVFVHGSGADLRTWGYQLQFFAHQRRAVAYSRRFHHPNALPGSEASYAPELHAADLAAFLRHLAADAPADVVAASYGGLVALIAARDHPGRFRRLVLVEPIVLALLPEGSDEARGAAGLDLARDQLVAGRSEEAIETFVTTVVGPLAYRLMSASTRQMLQDNLPELRAEAAYPRAALVSSFGCDDARKISVPTLLVSGSLSAPFLKRMSRELAGCLPEAETVEIGGAAHAVHAQQVAAFNDAVAGFLDGDR